MLGAPSLVWWGCGCGELWWWQVVLRPHGSGRDNVVMWRRGPRQPSTWPGLAWQAGQQVKCACVHALLVAGDANTIKETVAFIKAPATLQQPNLFVGGSSQICLTATPGQESAGRVSHA